jgi:hypothetical protein
MEAEELDDTAILRFVDGVKQVIESWRHEAAGRRPRVLSRSSEIPGGLTSSEAGAAAISLSQEA